MLQYFKKTAYVLAGSLFLLSVGGCSMGDAPDINNMNEYSNETFVRVEDAPEAEDAVPDITTDFLVDRNAYPSSGGKEAFVKGAKLPEDFRLVDAATGEVVYSGQIEEAAYYPELGFYMGCMDFGPYATEGNYYLECDHIGRSYAFSISPAPYRELFEGLYGEMAEDCRDGTAGVEDALALLLAYEWWGGSFGDKDQNGIPDVMEVLAEWNSRIDYGAPDVSGEMLYAAFLGKFSYLYKEYDKKYALECQQYAIAVYEQAARAQTVTGNDASQEGASRNGVSQGGASQEGASRNGVSQGGASQGGASRNGVSQGGALQGGASRNGVSQGDASQGDASQGGASQDSVSRNDDSRNGTLQNDAARKAAEKFLALAELYRATGFYTYRTKILEYKNFFQENDNFYEEPCYLYGAMTYMSTRHRVDVGLCTRLMNLLLEDGAEIAGSFGGMPGMASVSENGAVRLLGQAVELSCTNYVLESSQYDCILENFLHCLKGRNLQSVCIEPAKENRAAYLLFLARLAALDTESAGTSLR